MLVYSLPDGWEDVCGDCAECLYTGLIHDTGVFKYSCTICKDHGNRSGISHGKRVLTLEVSSTTASIKRLMCRTRSWEERFLKALHSLMDGGHFQCPAHSADLDFYGVTAKRP